AWFIGYSPEIVSGVWVGYDEHKTLGKRETGAQAALPIWIKYMQKALRRVPFTSFSRPDKIVSVAVDADTGLLAFYRHFDRNIEKLANFLDPLLRNLNELDPF
ncbi:MAG: hypothetical protein ACWGQW_10905, partial [bacterium]